MTGESPAANSPELIKEKETHVKRVNLALWQRAGGAATACVRDSEALGQPWGRTHQGTGPPRRRSVLTPPRAGPS